MNRLIVAGAATAVLVSAIAGYRIGAGTWPNPLALSKGAAPAHVDGRHAAERVVLYWKDPDGKPDFSPTPKKTADGRDYIAVYEDQEADFKEAREAELAKAKGAGRKIIHYRNPMGLPDISPVPKKDWMGMDYIPVYEGEEDTGSTVRISLDRVQRSGVRSEEAQMRRLVRPIRAPGIAKPDERTLRSVTLRADGFIEALYVNETGKHIRAGERLFRVYSPLIVSAQIEFRIAGKSAGALQRLKNLDVPEHVIDELRNNPNPTMTIDWPAPQAGVVMEKKVIAGQMAKAGEELYRIVDLSSIWVIADVSEQDFGLVNVGLPASIVFRGLPDRTFEGYVAFVLHELDARTRTAKVRIEVKNPEHHIKHEMYADVEIDAGAGQGPRLTVPTSAVIDSGSRQVVIVERGEGLFEPRPVKLGLRGDGLIEIREGLKAGEKVVITANFLIDAESNLRAALKGFTADAAPLAETKP